MFLFAIAHYYSFSHKPFVDHALGYQDCYISFRAMWDISDVRADVVDHVRVVGEWLFFPEKNIEKLESTRRPQTSAGGAVKNSFLCQLTCESADIMASLCGIRRVNNFSSKTTRPRDMLFF